MIPPEADTVVVRHGEVGVKSSKVQIEMENALRDNLDALLSHRGVEGHVEREWSRIYVRANDVESATEAACDSFGVVSASPAVSVAPEKGAITDALTETADAIYDSGSFAVSARRAGEHAFTSKELEEDGGSAVWNAVEDGFEPEVDLDDPDVEFFVECRDDEAFVFLEKRDGPGGLPLGTQGRVVALVSGGIDSPVAAWMAMKRGCEVVPVYVDLGSYGGVDHEARAFEAVRTLSEYAPERDMRVRRIRAGDDVDYLVEEVGKTRMLSYRRYMLRAAERVAENEGAVGVVTGESIGQKSSQTSSNLRVVDGATTLPVHRPLLTMDKQEIVERAREIGSYDDSTVDTGCNRIAPSGPRTSATVDEVLRAEPDDLLERAESAADDAVVEEI